MGRRPPTDRGYRLLLRLYPPAFRARFGGNMADLFRARRPDAVTAPQHGGVP